MKKAILFLIVAMIAFNSGAQPSKKQLKKPPFKNYPEKGWQMFPTFRESDFPGTLFGITKNETKVAVDNVMDWITPPKPETFMTLENYKSTNIDFNSVVDFMKLNLNLPLNISDSVNWNRQTTIYLKLEGAQRITPNDNEILCALGKIQKKFNNAFDYRKFAIRKSIIQAKSIHIKFDTRLIQEYKLNANFLQAAAGVGFGVAKYDSSKSELVVTFEKPQNIFFLDLPINLTKPATGCIEPIDTVITLSSDKTLNTGNDFNLGSFEIPQNASVFVEVVGDAKSGCEKFDQADCSKHNIHLLLNYGIMVKDRQGNEVILKCRTADKDEYGNRSKPNGCDKNYDISYNFNFTNDDIAHKRLLSFTFKITKSEIAYQHVCGNCNPNCPPGSLPYSVTLQQGFKIRIRIE